MTGDIDTTAVIAELLPVLHTDTTANLYWWTQNDLIQWMDEALKRLARKAGVFIQRSTSTVSAAGVPAYPLPVGCVAVLHQSYLTTPLRAAGTMELESRDPDYQTTPGTPDHWYADQIGDYTIGFSPVPVTAGDLMPIIYTALSPDLDVAQVNVLVTAPVPLKGYLAMSVLGEAYGREGEMEMQDLAAHCKSRVAMYEAMMAEYYGSGT